jgi:hypothetical protein
MITVGGKITTTIPTGNQLARAVREAVREEMLAVGNELAGRISQNVRDMGITTNGAAGLAGSWSVSSGTLGGSVDSVRVVSPTRYASYVEFGTAGAMTKARKWPPLEPLIAWVALKMRFSATVRKSGTSVVVRRKGARWRAGMLKPRVASEQEEILRIARAVQRKIYWRGTKARLYVKAAMNSLKLDAVAVPEEQTQSMVYAIKNFDAWLAKRPFWDEVVKRARGSHK